VLMGDVMDEYMYVHISYHILSRRHFAYLIFVSFLT